MPITRHMVYAPHVEPPADAQEEEQDSAEDEKFADFPNALRRKTFRPYAPYIGPGPRMSIDDGVRSSVTFDPAETSLFNIDTSKQLRDIKVSKFEREENKLLFTDGVKLKLDTASLEAESLSIANDGNEILAEGDVYIYTDTTRLNADKLYVRRSDFEEENPDSPARPLLPVDYFLDTDGPKLQGEIEAHQLKIRESEKFFEAEYIQFNTETNTGTIKNGHGWSGIFYFSAEKIVVTGPQSIEATNLWLTTCDNPKPHYKIRVKHATVKDGHLIGTGEEKARFQFRKFAIPFYFPTFPGTGDAGYGKGAYKGFDLDIGNTSDLGYFLNLGQWYSLSPNVDMAYRYYPTSRQGIAGGIDVNYTFMDDPASRLFRSTGQFQTLYTTKDEGYLHWYHRKEVDENTVILGQWEQWYNQDFLKQFYEDDYEDRTGPRTFTNVTHLGDGYILTATASKATHDFTRETEKLPDASLHFLERQLGGQLYFTMDSYAGYYNRVPSDTHSQRYAHVARLSYDWNVMQGLNVLPFIEGGATHYSDALNGDESEALFSGVTGITTQARFQRAYKGRGRFSGFKHLFIPSVSYINQENSAMDIEDVPRFDDIDDRPRRDRIESKIDNIILGRNKANGETWRVAQLTVFQGYDLSNEASETKDVEVDLRIRPRPWWGFQAIDERYRIDNNTSPIGDDYHRFTSYLFYNNTRYDNTWNARIGYEETEIDDFDPERNILYGAGYKLNDMWSISADHRYSLESSELIRQRYELRRRLHMWEMGLVYRDRPSGSDLNITFSLVGLKDTDLKF